METCAWCRKQRESALNREFQCGKCIMCLCYFCSNIPKCQKHSAQFQVKVSKVSIEHCSTKALLRNCTESLGHFKQRLLISMNEVPWSLHFHRDHKEETVLSARKSALHWCTNAKAKRIPVKLSFVNTVQQNLIAVIWMSSRPKSAGRHNKDRRHEWNCTHLTASLGLVLATVDYVWM